ncbi:MAG: tetratricopeptide repeat protein [bacterium]
MMKRPRVARLALPIAVLGILAGGCQTGPARVWRGARHYSAGTDALVAGESARAVRELEQAAGLVPGASEIRNHLGIAYLAEGREAAARAAFESALDLDCGNRAARQNLDELLESEPAVAPVPTPTAAGQTEKEIHHGG